MHVHPLFSIPQTKYSRRHGPCRCGAQHHVHPASKLILVVRVIPSTPLCKGAPSSSPGVLRILRTHNTKPFCHQAFTWLRLLLQSILELFVCRKKVCTLCESFRVPFGAWQPPSARPSPIVPSLLHPTICKQKVTFSHSKRRPCHGLFHSPRRVLTSALNQSRSFW